MGDFIISCNGGSDVKMVLVFKISRGPLPVIECLADSSLDRPRVHSKVKLCGPEPCELIQSALGTSGLPPHYQRVVKLKGICATSSSTTYLARGSPSVSTSYCFDGMTSMVGMQLGHRKLASFGIWLHTKARCAHTGLSYSCFISAVLRQTKLQSASHSLSPSNLFCALILDSGIVNSVHTCNPSFTRGK